MKKLERLKLRLTSNAAKKASAAMVKLQKALKDKLNIVSPSNPVNKEEDTNE